MTKPPEPVVTGELRPCPFDGGAAKADTEESDDVGGFFVSCTKCGASVWGVEKGEAIAAWNTRTAHALPGDVGMNLAAAFGPILRESFPDHSSVERMRVGEALAEAVLSRTSWFAAPGDEVKPSALGKQVREMALPDDPHTDAWQLGFCRSRKMAADLVDEMLPKIAFAYKGAYIEAEAHNANFRAAITPSAMSGDAGGAMAKHTFLTCVSGDGPTPYLKVHFNNLADAHAAHDELLGRKGKS